jgi:nucleotide-binding universal stress UspA family protein
MADSAANGGEQMRILIGVDGSSAANVACDLVADRTWAAGTRVSLLGVVEPLIDWTGMAPSSGEGWESRHATLGVVIEERADALRRRGLIVDTAVDFGAPADLLIDRAAETFTDLIVVGSRGLGAAASAVFGSVSAYLVDHAGCPVLVARSPEATRMLLATDGTPSAAAIPRMLASWGSALRGLPVEVLSVAPRNGFVTPWSAADDEDGPAGDAELVVHERIAEQVADELIELGWHAAAVARAGDPGRQIVTAGREWGADLIVTGSRGISTLRRIVMGSVAHDVLLHARSSVLVMRGHVPSWSRQPAAQGALAV